MSANNKKILQSSPLSGIAVPIAIVLVGALIIFGVSKMLSTGRDHKDLIQELHSKTFGNRWVAAYELSKFIATSKIPKEDIPWMIENLIRVYKESVDPRTRNFVVLALGSLKNDLALPLLNAALGDPDPQVRFNAVVSLGNFPRGVKIDWEQIKKNLMESQDNGVKQAAILAISTHQIPDAQIILRPFVQSSEKMLRYSAAIGLIWTKENSAISVLKEILSLNYTQAKEGEFNGAQVEGLKVNLIEQLIKDPWPELAPMLTETSIHDSNIKVRTKAQEALNLLKK
jgi:HEAT repeat protein